MKTEQQELLSKTNEIPLNTFKRSIQSKSSVFGDYYYVFNDTLFHLDLRVTYHSNIGKYHIWGKVFHYDENNECYRFDMESKIRTYLKERSFEGFVQAGIDVVNYEGEYFYDELMKIKSRRKIMSLEEWKSLHVESYLLKQERDLSGFPAWKWNDVAQCGCSTNRRRIISETCPTCGTSLVEVFVSTSSETWENLCGREGVLTFCPKCQKQIRFHLECMN